MKIDNELIDILLYGEEGVDLDFKRDQYRFSGASDKDKGELLKDIIAFANSWRRSDAFILIGIKEVKGGKSEVVGISEKLDDAQIQQFVNSKTQKPITFSYRNFDFESKNIGVIHIPIQSRPFYLNRDYANLKRDTVYIRRGSSTDIAKLDEISKMGVTHTISEDNNPILELFFADKKNRIILPDTLSIFSMVLNTPRPKDIPDYRGNQRRPNWPLGFEAERPNYSYYRELAEYTLSNRLLNQVNFAITNTGSIVAKDVRVEITIKNPQKKIVALDKYDMPKPPKASYSTFDVSNRLGDVGSRHDLTAKQISDYWLIETGVEKVQPKSTAWIKSPLFLGAIETQELCIETSTFSDNLPEPVNKKLLVKIESQNKEAPLDVIKELETDRYRNSDEYKQFIERHQG
jgi:hypothetical protein